MTSISASPQGSGNISGARGMALKTYVINLETSIARRRHMEGLLAPYPFINPEFVKAIDGRMMSEKERREVT